MQRQLSFELIFMKKSPLLLILLPQKDKIRGYWSAGARALAPLPHMLGSRVDRQYQNNMIRSPTVRYKPANTSMIRNTVTANNC